MTEIKTEQKNTGENKKDLKKNKRSSLRSRKSGEARIKQEFDSKILDIRRVTRVSSGGRRFSFSVTIIAGDKKGRVGVGIGKAGDTALAVEKATKIAKKNLLMIKTNKYHSIPHPVEAKYNSAVVRMVPAPGRGLIAGSALRDVLELGGVKDINAKILSGSKNKLNIARATIKALKKIKFVKENEKKTSKNDNKVLKK